MARIAAAIANARIERCMVPPWSDSQSLAQVPYHGRCRHKLLSARPLDVPLGSAHAAVMTALGSKWRIGQFPVTSFQLPVVFQFPVASVAASGKLIAENWKLETG